MIILFQLLALVINKMVYICWMETLNILGTDIRLNKRNVEVGKSDELFGNWTIKMIVSFQIFFEIGSMT